MAIDPAKADSLPKLQMWAVEHQAEISKLWSDQLIINKEQGALMKSVQKKVVWAAGFAAGVGAMTPWIIAKILGM